MPFVFSLSSLHAWCKRTTQKANDWRWVRVAVCICPSGATCLPKNALFKAQGVTVNALRGICTALPTRHSLETACALFLSQETATTVMFGHCMRAKLGAMLINASTSETSRNVLWSQILHCSIIFEIKKISVPVTIHVHVRASLNSRALKRTFSCKC